jgi:ribonucleoside-diphosphate reductase alpha chain
LIWIMPPVRVRGIISGGEIHDQAMDITDDFDADIARVVWQAKYRLSDPERGTEASVADTWRRVAAALAAAEPADRERWEARFFEALRDFRFLPGGRILAGAGTGRRVTLFNCFVMGPVADSMDGIFEALKEGALTMQQGGGVGYDFSTLRPRGTPARSAGTIASGPVSFMRIWDAMCATILSTGARRGAMMGTLRCDHPDIEAFVDAKRDSAELRHFNLSVLVTDEFMDAVHRDEPWPLVFPADSEEPRFRETIERVWPGSDRPRPCAVYRRVGARALWERIMRAAYDSAEPGVIFIDRVQRANNLYYCETISTTNPCGEIPLPPYGACDLGSINLTRFVKAPFTAQASLDLAAISEIVRTAVRMLDNVYDVSGFPLEKQRRTALASRRIGLGITGLADALVMLGLRYDTARARELAAAAMRAICESAYRASVDIAREKGAFPEFRAADYVKSEFVSRLPRDIVDAIRRHGIRNSHLTAIAPAGTISLLAGNVSSGLEPIYGAQYRRRVRTMEGTPVSIPAVDYACALYRRMGQAPGALPPAFVTANEVPPEAHLEMQAALQAHVDSAISKTINVPSTLAFDAFRALYERAYALGLKGCTVFRPNPVTGSVLEAGDTGAPAAGCCVERGIE